MASLETIGATEARRLLARRAISARELLDACIARIEAREAAVHAWAHLDIEGARRRATELDGRTEQGPLHGIPIGIKDIIDTADMPTAWGSEAFATRRPAEDAVCVARLREAGAVILGKTVTTEFAYFSPGPTRNPRDLGRTPGGSSSGSAAAVADFMVPLAMGTQAAGSTIRPASFCGVPAFKPSHARWDMSGSLRLYPTVDTLSVFVRDWADAALVDAVLGPGETEPAPPPRRAIIFVPAEWYRATPACRDALALAADRARSVGMVVEEVAASDPFDQLVWASDTIIHVEAARNGRAILEAAPRALSPIFLDLLEKGARIPNSDHDAALDIRRRARAAWTALLGREAIALTPAAPAEAPEGLSSTGDPVFIRTWNVIGAPAVNLPLHEGPAGMPIGVQAVAIPGNDRALLAAAAMIQGHPRG